MIETNPWVKINDNTPVKAGDAIMYGMNIPSADLHPMYGVQTNSRLIGKTINSSIIRGWIDKGYHAWRHKRNMVAGTRLPLNALFSKALPLP